MGVHAQHLKNRTQEFGGDHCFLCGMYIPEGSHFRTVEHVFPKWLLREMDLWKSTVHQLNNELLAYRQLTVPCCSTCNGTDLSGVESRVRMAFQEGMPAFKALDPTDLFIWLGKIYYGLVYKESLRPRNPREQSGERVVPFEHLESIAFHHFLLQAAAGRVSWLPERHGPATFHFFDCLDDESAAHRFDYMDDIFVPMIGLRMGKIGVICVLQDWGRSEGVQQPHLNAARSMRLHPTQFREIYGRISYMTKLSWKDLTHLVVERDNSVLVVSGDPGGFEGTFVSGEFAHVLASLWGVPVTDIYSDGSTFTTIKHESGAPMQMANQRVIFTAPFGTTGLWPAHNAVLADLDLSELPSPASNG